MINRYDIAYGLGIFITGPYWLVKSSARKKLMHALNHRMGRMAHLPEDRPRIWIHAVSVGEVNATRALIEQLAAQRPDLSFVVSTTTQTGFERGTELYGQADDIRLIRFPLDFTDALNRALDAIRPSIVVLMELEVWPNFMRQCEDRKIPVVLANGRLTAPSYRRYKWILPVSRAMFGRLARVCAQDEIYARRFADLGAAPDRIRITGTMKFDNAKIEDHVQGDLQLAREVGLDPTDEFIWVCGSTGPGEEKIILREYRELLKTHGRMRLVIVPRHPPRFDEVAELVLDHKFWLVRRSQQRLDRPSHEVVPPVVLGDTMGELRKFYSLANVVFDRAGGAGQADHARPIHRELCRSSSQVQTGRCGDGSERWNRAAPGGGGAAFNARGS